MPGEEVGSAYATIGIKIDEAGLNAAQTKISGAVRGIESGMGGLRSGLGSELSASFSGIAASMGPIGGALSAIGPAGIAAGAGIAVVGGAISSSVSVAANFEQSMSRVNSVLGGSAADFQTLSTAAREAGASSTFSASQAADALYFLASAGYNTQETTAALGSTLDLAASDGMDLGRAAEMVTGNLAVFGLGAEEAGRVTNLLAASAAASNSGVGQMGDALRVVGGTANALGMSVENTTAVLSVMANGGIKAAEAGHKLNSILGELSQMSGSTATKAQATALSELGISADQVNPALHSTEEIFTLLQEKGMTAAQALQLFGKENQAASLYVAANATKIGELETKITGTNKASEMATTQTDNYAGAMSEFSGAIEEAQITLGTTFLPVLTDVTQALTTGVRAGLEFADSISTTIGGITSAFSEAASGGSLADIDDAFLKALGVDTGEKAGEQLAEGVASSEDLAAAPGEALGSPEALDAVGDAAEDAGETYEERLKRQVAEWKNNFVGEIFGESGNLEDKKIGEVNIGGGLFTTVDYDFNNDFGNYRLNTPTGRIEYSSLDEMRDKAPEDIAAYIGRELTALEKAQALGDTQLAIQLQANPDVEFQFDFDIEKALSWSPTTERGALYNMLLTTLNNAGTDAATEGARTTAEEYGKALQEVDWANLPGLQAASAKLKAAKGELYSGVGDKSWADLIDNQTDAYKDALMAQITDISEFTKQQGEELAGSITDAFSDHIFDEDDRALVLAMEPMLDVLEKEAPEYFDRSGLKGIAAFIEAVKSGASSAELDAMWDKISGNMKPLGEEIAKNFYAGLADGSGRFFGDFMTEAKNWTDFVLPEGGFAGPTEYYDEYYAAQAGQQIRAMEALQNVADIKASLTISTDAAKEQLQAFYDEQSKDEGKSELEKTLEINDDQAKTDIQNIDTAAKLGVIKPFSLDGVDYAMGQIAAIDAAARRPITKMVYVQEVGGSGGIGSGGSQGTWDPFNWLSFANEGYVRSPTLAVIGDRPGGEYVVGADRFEAAAAKMGNNNNTRGGDVNIYVTVQGSVTGEDLIDQIVEQSKKAVAYDMARGKKW